MKKLSTLLVSLLFVIGCSSNLGEFAHVSEGHYPFNVQDQMYFEVPNLWELVSSEGSLLVGERVIDRQVYFDFNVSEGGDSENVKLRVKEEVFLSDLHSEYRGESNGVMIYDYTACPWNSVCYDLVLSDGDIYKLVFEYEVDEDSTLEITHDDLWVESVSLIPLLDSLESEEAEVETIQEPLEEAKELEPYGLTINGVMSFDMPASLDLVDSSFADGELPLKKQPATYTFDKYEDGKKVGQFEMDIRLLGGKPTLGEFLGQAKEDPMFGDRINFYIAEHCVDPTCFYLEDLGRHYYEIGISDASLEFSDLDWLLSARTPGGGGFTDEEALYFANEPGYESELISSLLKVPGITEWYSEDRIVGAIEVLDEENYYLEIGSGLWDGDASFTVFLHGGKRYYAYESKGCGPACSQTVTFYEDAPFGLSELPNFLPELDYSDMEGDFDPFVPLIRLPQHSTIIEVYQQFGGDILYKLHWKGGKFEVERVY